MQILGSCQRAEKVEEHESDGDTNYSWWPWNGPDRPGKILQELKIADEESSLPRTLHS